MSRCCFRSVAVFALTAAIAGAVQAADPVKIRFVLDWKYQGLHAWYFLAQDKGYYKAEGLDVVIDQGEGSAATITKIAGGAYNAGFGDMNAIIQLAAAKPQEAPSSTNAAAPPPAPAEQSGSPTPPISR